MVFAGLIPPPPPPPEGFGFPYEPEVCLDVKTLALRVNSAPGKQTLAATDQWDNLILCISLFSQEGTVAGLYT